jgi:4-hydroxysphinganine ceramide fatty acyl 2-hydroxylase
LNVYVKEFLRDKRVWAIGIAEIICLFMAIMTTPRANPWLPLVTGVVLFYFIEYFVHRFVLHGVLCKLLPGASEGHAAHHEHPLELRYLLTPNAYNLTTYSFLWGIIALITRSPQVASLTLTSLIASQLYYEWAHFVAHRPMIPKTPWGKWMKKFHLLHHYKDAHNWYGVTNPSLDMLMRTHKSRVKATSKAKSGAKSKDSHISA